MISFLFLVCLASVAGAGVFRLLGRPEDHNVLFGPALVTACVLLILFWGLLAGLAVSVLAPICLLLCLLAAFVEIRALSKNEIMTRYVPVLACALLAGCTFLPFFFHGITNFTGSWFWDKWFYVLEGRELFDFGLTGSAPTALLPFTSSMEHTRFAGSALLAVLTPITGMAGDSLSVFGIFFVFCLFILGASSAGLAQRVLSLRGIRLLAFISVVTAGFWPINLIIANNVDNLLYTALFPTLIALACQFRHETEQANDYRLSAVLGLFLATTTIVYPELTPLALSAIGLCFFTQSPRPRVAHCIACGLVAFLCLAPWLPALGHFFGGQVDNVLASDAIRPGKDFYAGLLHPTYVLASWFGFFAPLDLWFLNTPTASAIPKLIIVWNIAATSLTLCGLVMYGLGIARLFRQKRYALLILGMLCQFAALVFLVVTQFDYGASKFLSVSWPISSIVLFAGADAFSEIARRHHLNRLALLPLCALFGFLIMASVHIARFDKNETQTTDARYTALRELDSKLPEHTIVNHKTASGFYWPRYLFGSETPIIGFANRYGIPPDLSDDTILEHFDAARVILSEECHKPEADSILWESDGWVLFQPHGIKTLLLDIRGEYADMRIRNQRVWRLDTAAPELNVLADSPGTIMIDATLIVAPESCSNLPILVAANAIPAQPVIHLANNQIQVRVNLRRGRNSIRFSGPSNCANLPVGLMNIRLENDKR
ncbi:hypothetical protein [Desulfovibrio inopinatus]|uniref:hypothetical protein n=1 Tax=Desulfovibrio inopinatus TaxID=102109 RepID=UPI00047FAA41|nr:hypothetical protein [Desulfovibrio inopinatus]